MKITANRKPPTKVRSMARVAVAFGAWALAAGCSTDTTTIAEETPVEIASATSAAMPRHPLDTQDVVMGAPNVLTPTEYPTPLALQRRLSNKIVPGKDPSRHLDEAPRASSVADRAESALRIRTLMANQSAYLVRARRLAIENPDLSPGELDVRRAALKAEMIGGAP